MSWNQPSNSTALTSTSVAVQNSQEGNTLHSTGVFKQPMIKTGTNPTNAALKMMNEIIATLHTILQRLVEDKGRPLLCVLIKAEQKQTSANKMLKNDAPIPSLVLRLARKRIVFVSNEVKERQEFKSLSEESATILERCLNDLRRIVDQATTLKADYLQEIAVKMYCHFLLFLVDNDKAQFLKLFKRHNGLATLPAPTNPAPKRDFVLLTNKLKHESTTQEGDDQDTKNDEDVDLESPASSPPSTGGQVVMVNKTIELLAGLLWEPWAKYCGENRAKNQSNRLKAYVEQVRKKDRERDKESKLTVTQLCENLSAPQRRLT